MRHSDRAWAQRGYVVMADEIFVKVVGDDGQETYQPVEDVEGFVKKTEPYGKVLQESIQRRQAIADLKKQLSALTASDEQQPDEAQDKKPEAKTEVKATEQLSEAELRKRILEDTLAELAARQQAERDRDNNIAKLIRDNGLTDADREFIVNSPDPAKAAEYLGKRLKPFQTTDRVAAPRTPEEAQSFQKRIQERMMTR